jgi:hypothetical protein
LYGNQNKGTLFNRSQRVNHVLQQLSTPPPFALARVGSAATSLLIDWLRSGEAGFLGDHLSSSSLFYRYDRHPSRDRPSPPSKEGPSRQYNQASQLLVQCLKQGTVSDAVRQEIEETLLLPLAELQHRQPKIYGK